MNILLKPFSSHLYRKNAIFSVDNGDNILFRFNQKLKKLGVTVNTLDMGSKDKVDCYVYCDVPYFWELDYWKELLIHRKKSILFSFESPIVNPFNQLRFLHRFFRRVYTWNDKLINEPKNKKFCLPVLNTNLKIKEVPIKKKKLLCVINSNKSIPYPFLLFSPFKKDLYPERLKAIDFFEKNISDQFDLFGRGWNAPMKFNIKEKIFGHKTYLSYRGAIPRNADAKVKVLRNYKFNLCFENCVADGYISEKIIDCFKAHTVPVYYGAPNIENFIPNSCFIDFRQFRNYESLLNFLANMSDQDYNRYINNGRKLLKNKKFKQLWLEDGFITLFLEALSFAR